MSGSPLPIKGAYRDSRRNGEVNVVDLWVHIDEHFLWLRHRKSCWATLELARKRWIQILEVSPINALAFLGMRSLVLHFRCSDSPAYMSHHPVFVRPLERRIPGKSSLVETSLIRGHRSWSLSHVHLRTLGISRIYWRVSVRIGLESWVIMLSHSDREEVICARCLEFLCCNWHWFLLRLFILWIFCTKWIILLNFNLFF